jgi:hypothetical protein
MQYLISYKFCFVFLETPVFCNTQYIMQIAYGPKILLYTEFIYHVTNLVNKHS